MPYRIIADDRMKYTTHDHHYIISIFLSTLSSRINPAMKGGRSWSKAARTPDWAWAHRPAKLA
jgi:hypothetical protein